MDEIRSCVSGFPTLFSSYLRWLHLSIRSVCEAPLHTDGFLTWSSPFPGCLIVSVRSGTPQLYPSEYVSASLLFQPCLRSVRPLRRCVMFPFLRRHLLF